MKILTVNPEWANLIVDGIKRIENRSWGKNVRGIIGIHRGGKYGAIIGQVEVVNVLNCEEALKQFPEQEEFISGSLCWILKNAIRFEKPIPHKGKLSLWEYNEKK